jgi:hypothetical protein
VVEKDGNRTVVIKKNGEEIGDYLKNIKFNWKIWNYCGGKRWK